MSELTGPGRNSEMSTIRSCIVRGSSLATSSRWPGDSIWKQPSVRPVQIMSYVAWSSCGTPLSRSMSWPSTRLTSLSAYAIADCMRTPSTSSLSIPASSTSSLSNWLIGNSSRLRSTGVRSRSPELPTSTPHGCRAMCRGSPSSFSASRNIVSSARSLRPLSRSSGRSERAERICLALMCGNALAMMSVSCGGRPMAAPTSRMALRAR